MNTVDLVTILGVPAALGAIVAFLIERWNEFHALTPFGKKVVTLILPYLVSYVIVAIALWVGTLSYSKELIVDTFLAASLAYAGSQGAHLLDYGKR